MPHQVFCEAIKPNLRLYIIIMIIHLQGKAVYSYLREPVVLHQLQLFSINTTNYMIVFVCRDSDLLRAGRPGDRI